MVLAYASDCRAASSAAAVAARHACCVRFSFGGGSCITLTFPPRTEILTHLGGAPKHHAFAVVLTWLLMCPPRKSNQSIETLRMCSVLGGTRKHFNFCDSRSWHQLPARGGVCHLRDPVRVTLAGTDHRWQMPTVSGSLVITNIKKLCFEMVDMRVFRPISRAGSTKHGR